MPGMEASTLGTHKQGLCVAVRTMDGRAEDAAGFDTVELDAALRTPRVSRRQLLNETKALTCISRS
jgi:hypothetical protein